PPAPHSTYTLSLHDALPIFDAVLDYSAGRVPRVTLPLDVRATAFQWQVWTALMQIPRGQKRTYGDMARAIGRPGAVRAVARACADRKSTRLNSSHSQISYAV